MNTCTYDHYVNLQKLMLDSEENKNYKNRKQKKHNKVLVWYLFFLFSPSEPFN